MKTSVKNQANITVANLGAHVEILPAVAQKPATKLAAAMAKADKLRISADASYAQYVIAGRDAVIALMGAVYALYCEIKKDDSTCKTAVKQMSAAVATDSQVRVTSTDASVLVRYVCREMGDKKVSIYSRCIALAHKNGVASDGLPALVKSTANGWLGVLSNWAPAKTGVDAGTAVETAEQELRKEVTVQNIPANDWGNDETVRVYIATYNDDATADIKHVCLSAESIEIVLKRYAADKAKLEKAAKEAKSTNTLSKAAIQIFEGDIANAETAIGNLRAEMDAAVAAGQHTSAAKQSDRLQVMELQHKGDKAALKAAKAEAKEAAAA